MHGLAGPLGVLHAVQVEAAVFVAAAAKPDEVLQRGAHERSLCDGAGMREGERRRW